MNCFEPYLLKNPFSCLSTRQNMLVLLLILPLFLSAGFAGAAPSDAGAAGQEPMSAVEFDELPAEASAEKAEKHADVHD